MSAESPDVPTPAESGIRAGEPPMPVPQTGWRFRVDNRFLAPILITCILAIGDFKYQILESYWLEMEELHKSAAGWQSQRVALVPSTG